MNGVRHIKQVADLATFMGSKPQHPLVTVICFDELPETRHSFNLYEIYGFFLHEKSEIELTVGKGQYHYSKDSLICVYPGMAGGKHEDGTTIKLTGWALLFHPSFLAGTELGKAINHYSIYTYPTNEALTLDPYERNIIVSIIRSIRVELEQQKHDHDMKSIVISYIELLLNYCQRAFNRQYHVEPSQNYNDRMAQLYTLLNKYYKDNLQMEFGLPSVAYCADKLHITPNYLGDIIKQSTGSSAINYIHRFVIAKAKQLLLNGVSISETAFQLGFDYPQHLSRLFKKIEGISPTDYQKNLLA